MTALLTARAEIIVQFHDLDPMNVVWHGNYLRYLEIARSELLTRLNYNYCQMQASGYVWPIVDVRLKYIQPLRLHQKVIVEAGLMEYENRLKIDYHLYDGETNQLLTKASTIQVAVKDGNSQLEFKCPQILIDCVERIRE